MTDKKVAPDEGIVPIAYSPRQFCRAAGISISLLYTLWREGRGPKFRYALGRRMITGKDATAWLENLPTEAPDNIRARMEKRKRGAA
jgi:hypothetical protein